MDPLKLFLCATFDGKPFKFERSNGDLLLEPITGMPYGSITGTYYWRLFNEDKWQDYTITLALPENAEVKLLYCPDGVPADDVAVEGIAEEAREDGRSYDLHGCKVAPENLAPGIDIRNGRKFVKR